MEQITLEEGEACPKNFSGQITVISSTKEKVSDCIYSNGYIKTMIIYKNGKRIICPYECDVPHGFCTIISENKKIQIEYILGDVEGLYIEYFSDKKTPKIIANQKNGIFNGKYTCLYPDGKPHIHCIFLKGKIHGIHKKYDKNGKYMKQSMYIDGIKVGKILPKETEKKEEKETETETETEVKAETETEKKEETETEVKMKVKVKVKEGKKEETEKKQKRKRKKETKKKEEKGKKEETEKKQNRKETKKKDETKKKQKRKETKKER